MSAVVASGAGPTIPKAVEGDVLLRGGRILAPSKQLLIRDLLLRGSRIAEVSTHVEPCDETRVLDLSGRVIMPGLIDAHTHLTHGYDSVLADTESRQGVRASHQALRALRAGLTTVRELGSYRQVDIALRDAIRAGLVLGPRMLCAGTYIAITGGHGHPKGRAADGPTEVRKAVREQVLAGADVIKVMCSGGAARADESSTASQFSQEEVSAIVEEANLAERSVAAHAHPTRSIKWALQAGARSIEHGTYLDEECCDLFLEHDAFLVPTLNVYATIAGSWRWPDLRDRADHLLKEKEKTLRLAASRGVRWAIGSDTSLFLPVESYWKELEMICSTLQISPVDGLDAATRGNAELLGLEDLGEISAGKVADLVVLRGDPTADLACLTQIEFTVCGGRVIEWSAIDGALGPSWWTRGQQESPA